MSIFEEYGAFNQSKLKTEKESVFVLISEVKN